MNPLKELLLARDIPPPSPVAMGLPRSRAWVETFLALIDAGYIAVLLDPDQPLARLQAQIQAAGAQIGIGSLPGIPCLSPQPYPLARPDFSPDNAIYRVFTSGSTGTPKQIEVSGRWLPTLLQAQVNAFDLHPTSRCLWLLSPAFDASISDVGTALWAGAELVPCGPIKEIPTFLDFLAQHQITHADLPPALVRLIDPKHLPPSFRVLIIGGEPCDPAALRKWAEVLTSRKGRVVGAYGPTETTVCVSTICVDPVLWDRPYLGTPLPGVRFQVVAGELWVAGDCLARPLQEDPRFVTHEGQAWYRTGDQVEMGPLGLFFVGRQDRQIKLRGYRIAPEEVERVLGGVSGVSGVAVALRQGQLVGWVEGTSSKIDLQTALQTQLPTWMHPRLVFVDRLPRTASGKVAFGELPSPDVAGTDLLGLKKLWQTHTGSDREDLDFFEAGGDSLGALRFLLAARAAGFPVEASVVAPQRTLGELLGGSEDDLLLVRAIEARIQKWKKPASKNIRIHSQSNPDTPFPPLLLTGATGFLGAHLLAFYPGEMWCLVRAGSLEEARQRVGATRVRYGLPFREFEVILGDVGISGLGLSGEERRRVVKGVRGILHGAARVSLVESWDRLAATNVAGVAEVLELAEEVGWLGYISTLSVFVGTTRKPGRVGPEDGPRGEDAACGGYAQTKIAAELLVQQSSVPKSIFRLGLLTGSATGPLPDRDLLTLFLRQLRDAHPSDVDPRFQVDMTPVDRAARAIVAALPDAPPVAHIAAHTGVFATELVDLAGTLRPGLPQRADFPALAAGWSTLSLFQRTGWDFTGSLERPDPALLASYLRRAWGQM